MLQIPFFFISLFFLFIASYTDLKQRIVPDKLNYGMLLLGLAGHAIAAVYFADAMILVFCIASTAIAFGFSYLLWKLGVWAGGDVKLFAALGALNPVNPNILAAAGLLNIGIFESVTLPIFSINLFIFSVIAMLPYGAIISAQRIGKKPAVRKEFLNDFKKKFFSSIDFAMAVVGFAAVLNYFQISILFELPLLVIYGFLKRYRIILAVIVFGFALSQEINTVFWFVFLVAFFTGFFLLFKLYALSKVLMRKKIGVERLEEGMILAETIMERNGEFEKAREFEIKKVINYLKHNKMQELQDYLKPKGRVIASSAHARGLIKEELEELKKLAKEKKISNALDIRESAPFVPAVLIGYIIVNLVGDFLWNAVFLL
ncbi:MAG: prepilin peptidase [Candidatus Diapherotrites archaeon]|nr:prepilin peptidase [Candidatus Diapherotrites archaeon]